MELLDAVVIGAGAAGLAAARELALAGKSFVVLEARGRLGGRAWTRRVRGFPVEMGAEFVHGRPPATMSLLRRAGLRALPLRESGGGGGGAWEDVEAVLKRLDPKRPDRPFSEALAAMRGVTPAQKARARDFVESFHAADARLLGARELAGEGLQGAENSSRIPEGYGALVDSLSAEAGKILRRAVVREVHWSARGVRVLFERGGRSRELAARTAVIAVPLGVLRARGEGGVRFVPSLPGPKRDALSFLRMGEVAKVGLLFKPSAWREASRALGGGFLRDPGGPFAVFWTANPLSTPLITAWSGGPGARALCRLGPGAVEALARRSLARALGWSEGELRAGLAGSFFHDWQADAFSRGAYSYAAAGGGGAREELARPVDGLLFFAGEACDARGQSGTVAGALDSGARAGRAAAAAPGPR